MTTALAKYQDDPISVAERAPRIPSLPGWLTHCLNAIEGDGILRPAEIVSDRAPTADQRGWLDAEVDVLSRALRPATAADAGVIVTQLMVAFPSQALEQKSAKYRSRAYLSALEMFPAWAIALACRDWLQGRGVTGDENFAFAPSPPQLVKLAEKHAGPAWAALHNLRRVRNARIIRAIPKAERDRVAKKFEALSAELANAMNADR